MKNIILEIQLNSKHLTDDTIETVAEDFAMNVEEQVENALYLYFDKQETKMCLARNDEQFIEYHDNFINVTAEINVPLSILLQIVDQCRSAIKSRRDNGNNDDTYSPAELHDLLTSDPNEYLKQLATVIHTENNGHE